MSNDSDTGFTGELNLYNLTSTTEEFLSVVLGCYQNSGASRLNKVSGGGNRANVEVVNAVRFAFSSGNLSSGTIKLYGIK
jgi:hypothetical protein